MSKQDGSNREVSELPVDTTDARILHVDMDAFFASVELLDRPELVGLPVIVGHASARSVVTAATYEARKFGVNSAMSMALALRRCPQAVVLEPHFAAYQRASAQVMSLLREVTPLVEPLSIDEAFLDVGGAIRRLGTPWQIGAELRSRIRAVTGLNASVGAATTKSLAKLASSVAKPNGLLVVPGERSLEFLHPKPISALWGLGPKGQERLAALGLRTVGELADTPVETLRRALGDASAERLHELAWARDPREVGTDRVEKSIGHETTFETDVGDRELLHRELLRLSNGVGARMRANGVQARTVSVKLRFPDFSTITRTRTLAAPSDVSRRVYEAGRELMDAALDADRRPLRLVGIRAEQLTGDAPAAALWDDDEDWRVAERAVDAVTARFGTGSVRPARLLGGGGLERMSVPD